MTGKFIVFEGPDGSGKTTQIKLLTERLKEDGFDVVNTREPGGTNISEKIRQILLDPQNKELCSKAEALLYAAARAQHVEELIKPQLAAGKIVISDRFVDSTLAYQGFGRQLEIDYLKTVNKMATGNLGPDLVVLIDIRPELGLKRIMENRAQSGQSGTDRIEQENISFHQKVREGFLALSQQDNERYLVVSGEKEQLSLGQEIYSQVKNKFNI